MFHFFKSSQQSFNNLGNNPHHYPENISMIETILRLQKQMNQLPFRERLKAFDMKNLQFPSSFYCLISFEVMNLPMIVNRNVQHVFDDDTLKKWRNSSAICPVTQEEIKEISFHHRLYFNINKCISTLESVYLLEKLFDYLGERYSFLQENKTLTREENINVEIGEENYRIKIEKNKNLEDKRNIINQFLNSEQEKKYTEKLKTSLIHFDQSLIKMELQTELSLDKNEIIALQLNEISCFSERVGQMLLEELQFFIALTKSIIEQQGLHDTQLNDELNQVNGKFVAKLNDLKIKLRINDEIVEQNNNHYRYS